MFSFRNKAAQARRKAANATRLELRWHRSYNWLLLLMPFIGGAVYLSYQDTLLPIKTIQLSGTFQYIDQQEVESTVRQFIGEGFFSLDIKRVQKTLGDKPWTESISIRRVWPDRLNIVIVEKRPVARWDKKHLLSDKAVVYRAKTNAFADLPLVYTADTNPGQMLHLYYRLASQFATLNESVVAVRKDSRGALDMQLENGLTIKVGRSDIERKIARFVMIYQQQIQPRLEQIQQLDLRYSNGFAVAWKKEVLQSRDQASLWRNNNV
jgi:cell division protein FtsQ